MTQISPTQELTALYDVIKQKDEEIAALQEHHDIYRDLSIALQKMVNDKDARIKDLEEQIKRGGT